jgi:hypothetical protein
MDQPVEEGSPCLEIAGALCYPPVFLEGLAELAKSLALKGHVSTKADFHCVTG